MAAGRASFLKLLRQQFPIIERVAILS